MAAESRAAGTEQMPVSKSTILVLLWTFTRVVWSIFTPPVKTFPARIFLLQPLWLVRGLLDDQTWVQDLAMFLVLHSTYGLWTGAWSPISTINQLGVADGSLRIYLHVFALLSVCGIFAGLIVYRGGQLSEQEESRHSRHQTIEESLLPPLLIASRTNHARIVPEKHAFSYSYLFVGIPVGFQGSVNGVLSVDSEHPDWFDVQSKDFLFRSKTQRGFEEKLKRYLHAQGVTDRDYAFAYLVTAPRFLGYSFNPVSFWYLYDSDTRLRSMVLEVNNTFDERRMYLLKANNAKTDQSSQTGGLKTLVFDTWEKDFHVSPFNSRKGTYSLKAIDPLAAFEETGHVEIDNTIVLRSSKDAAKIVARVFSEGTPQDPTFITTFQLIKFIAAWWWVGLATYPRIVWEAQRLFFKRKLHVWYRPETAPTNLGRSYSSDEESLEEIFRAFLTHAVEHSNKALRVIYEPAHNEDGEIVLYSPGFTYEEAHTRTLTLKVLTPAFYSRFIHYAHSKEAFDRECLATDERNRTLIIESAHALPILLEAIDDVKPTAKSQLRRPGWLERQRWSILQRLRCPPAAASYSSEVNKVDEQYSSTDIRAFQHSELDHFVQQHGTDVELYCRIATKLFVAERLVFGVPALLTLWDWVFRAIMILAAMIYSNRANVYDLLRPETLGRSDIVTGGSAMLLANAVHIWSFVKGWR